MVLKLYDRRFALLIRKQASIQRWNKNYEQAYHVYVQSGEADDFISYLNRDDDDDDDDSGSGGNDDTDDKDDWTDAQNETYLYDKACDLYHSETLAYHTLRDLQGVDIPQLLGTVLLRTHVVSGDRGFQKFFDVPGILLEDCDGFKLEDLANNAGPECWQGICNKAVSIVNSVSSRGVLNRDVRPGNFIVRKTSSTTGTIYRPVMIDFALTRLRAPAESDAEWIEAKRSQDEEGAIGFVMQHRLRKIAKGFYTYKPSYHYG